MILSTNGAVFVGSLLILTLFAGGHRVDAAGLNTQVALTPPEDGTIIRFQWRYSELSDDPTPMDRQMKLSVQPVTVVYGVTKDLAILNTFPIIYREVDFGAGKSVSDTGIGDIPLLAKYRFFQDDQPGRTTRWAVIGGAEIPTYDEPFSSESLDPVIGTVWTHQRLDWWVDLDILYQFNTAGGLDGDDALRSDMAYSQRLVGGKIKSLGPWGFYAIAELNGKYITDSSTQLFAAPGVQFITPRWVLEAGVQLPIHQDLESPRLESDYTTVLSVRFQF